MKRIVVALTAALMMFGICATSYSQDASSSSYQPVVVAPETKPTSGYEGGYFIQGADDDWKIKFNARVDTMFFWQSSHVPDDVTTALNESLDVLSFRVRRAQFIIQPSYKKFSGFLLVGSAIPGGTYWVGNGQYKPFDNFTITFGDSDAEYDLIGLVSSKWLTMVDLPVVATQQDGEQPVWSNIADAQTVARPSFGLPTQLGIFLSGNFFNGRFMWAASVGNGTEGTDALNSNRQFQYALRLAVVALGEDPYGSLSDYNYSETPSLALGVGGAFEHDDRKLEDPPFTKQYNWALDGTADAVFKFRGFSANLSGYYRQIKTGPGATIEAGEKYLTDIGYFASLAMFAIPKKLEFQGFGSQIIREGPDNNVYEFGGGVNYYIKGGNLKFQLDYARVIDYDDIVGTNNRATNRVRAKMQMAF